MTASIPEKHEPKVVTPETANHLTINHATDQAHEAAPPAAHDDPWRTAASDSYMPQTATQAHRAMRGADANVQDLGFPTALIFDDHADTSASGTKVATETSTKGPKVAELTATQAPVGTHSENT